MGHYVLELETTKSKLEIVCQLHHYYQSTCSCGHQSKSQPGVGISSKIEGRTRDLKLTEYVLVGSNKRQFDCQSGSALPIKQSEDSGISGRLVRSFSECGDN